MQQRPYLIKDHLQGTAEYKFFDIVSFTYWYKIKETGLEFPVTLQNLTELGYDKPETNIKAMVFAKPIRLWFENRPL